jgi:hypothetical protein
MNITSSERRLRSRVKIGSRLVYYFEDPDETYEGELEDLSIEGARIWIQQDLPLKSQLTCRVGSDDTKEKAIEFIATLLHKYPEARGSWSAYGCSIDEIE